MLSLLQTWPDFVLMTTPEEFKIISLFTVKDRDSKRLNISRHPRLWDKQLNQDPKLGPLDSKVYLFQDVPVFTGKKKNKTRFIRPWGMDISPRGPDTHTTSSPHLADKEQVLTHRWIWCTGAHFFLSVLGRLESFDRLLRVTRLRSIGKALRVGITGVSRMHSLNLEWWSYLIS